ncbi:MAG: hypothetical protein V4687_00865 [Bacteroidota bacterium]
MKSNSISLFAGKAGAKLFTLTLAISAFMMSCEKNTEPGTSSITDAEIVSIASGALGVKSGGLELQTQSAVILSITNQNPAFCGTVTDTTVIKQLDSGAVSYRLAINWRRTNNCAAGVVSSFTHVFGGTASYTTPELSSNDELTGNFTLSGFGPGSNDLLVNQRYERSGTQKFKSNDGREVKSKITISTSNLKLSRGTGRILSGEGTFLVSGTAGQDAFEYSGSITFQGSGKATLSFTGGKSYPISWK